MSLRIRRTLEILAFTAVYFVVARLGLLGDPVSGFGSLVWPPTGISLAVLLLYGRRLWPGVFLGAFLFNVSIGAPALAALSVGAGNVLEAVAGVYLLRAFGFENSFNRLRDVFAFVSFGALLSTTLSATVGVASLSFAGVIPAPQLTHTWLTWWIGDVMGALILSPLILVWSQPLPPALSIRRLVEGAILVAVLVVIAELNFGSWVGTGAFRYVRPYSIFPVLIWASLRFEQWGGTISTLLLSIIAVWLTDSGSGMFGNETLSERLILLQIFMAVVALTTLCLAAATSERRLAVESLRAAVRDVANRQLTEMEIKKLNKELEQRVQDRTAELEHANAALVTEVRERKGAQEMLLRSRELFRNLVENINEIFYVVDHRGRLAYGSPNLYLRTGYTETELVGRSYVRLIEEEDRRRVVEHYRERANDGTVDVRCEFRALLKDRSTVWIEQLTRIIRNADGSVIEYRNVIRDISKRKETEEKLRETRDLLEGIINNSTAVVYVKDAGGRYLLINSRFEQLFHESKTSVLGKTDHDIFPASLARKFRENDLEVLRSGKLLELEEVAPHDDGPHTYISLKVPLLTESGAPFAICGISTDITDRKRAEREIAESHERYRVFFEDSPISLWEEDFSEVKGCIDRLREGGVSDFRGYVKAHPEFIMECAAKVKVLDVNKATLVLYEAHSKEDFLPGLRTVLAQDSGDVFREEVLSIADGATAFESEGINTTFTGNRINITLKWSVAPGFEKTYSRVLVSIIDLTERKRTEQALIRLGAIVESSGEAIIGVTLAGIVTSWNRGAEKTYGYRAGEAVGRHIAALLIAPGGHSDVMQLLGKIEQGETVERLETQRWRKDGSRIDIMLTHSPIRDQKGRITGVASISRDITEQKRVGQQIRLLAQALESTTEMICITNLENRIIYANKAFLRTYGYAEDEIIQKDPSFLRSPRNPQHLGDEIFAFSRAEGWTGELLNCKKDGTEFPVYLNTSPILGNEGAILGLIGVARDISDITNAEAVLWDAASRIENLFDASSRQALHEPGRYERYDADPAKRKHDLARDIGEVLGMLRTRAQQTLSFSSLASHQLRTPLTILRSQLENALRPDLSAVSLRKTLGSTYDEILRLSHIVDVLLSMSRMQAGTIKFDFQEIDFSRLMEEFHKESLFLVEEKNISIDLKKGPQVFIQADPIQIRQVLLNLLENAIKFTPVKGSIILSYVVEGEELVFQFNNSGNGIEPDVLPHIFDPFRSGESGSGIKSGTGLGLALVKWIIEGHRGKVDARSVPGEGTTILVRLPVRTRQ